MRLILNGRRPRQRYISRLLAFYASIACAAICCAADEVVEFPIPVYNDLLTIPVTISGTEHLCVIDSGATDCMLHTSLRPALGKTLGKEIIIAANGRQVDVDTYSAPTIQVGNFPLNHIATTPSKDDGNILLRGVSKVHKSSAVLLGASQCEDRVACIDITHIQETLGRNIEALVGMPLFRSATVQLNFDERRLRILPASTSPSEGWGIPIHIAFSKLGSPTIEVEMPDGVKETCTVDTGFDSSISLRSSVFSRLADSHNITYTDDSPVMLISGFSQQRYGRLTRCSVSGNDITDLRVSETNAESRIGLQFLRRFCVTFDCGREAIYLKKGVGFTLADQEPAVGIGLRRNEDKTLVAYVRSKSPGEQAGILKGDELISVGGVSVAGKPIAEIRWMYRDKADADRKLVLSVQRDRIQREILLTIAK